jgi:hypothetical protein
MAKAVLAALAALSIVGFATPSEAGDPRTRRECRANGAGDISMSARWEVRGSGPSARRKFTTEFEAAPGGAFAEGDRIVIRVDGANVGSERLAAVVGGDLVGDLNLDSNPREGDAKPFPSNFPAGVGRGSQVSVLKGGAAVLSCSLR